MEKSKLNIFFYQLCIPGGGGRPQGIWSFIIYDSGLSIIMPCISIYNNILQYLVSNWEQGGGVGHTQRVHICMHK